MPSFLTGTLGCFHICLVRSNELWLVCTFSLVSLDGINSVNSETVHLNAFQTNSGVRLSFENKPDDFNIKCNYIYLIHALIVWQHCGVVNITVILQQERSGFEPASLSVLRISSIDNEMDAVIVKTVKEIISKAIYITISMIMLHNLVTMVTHVQISIKALVFSLIHQVKKG